MSDSNKNLFGLSTARKQRIIDKMRNRSKSDANTQVYAKTNMRRISQGVPEEFYQVEQLPGLKHLQIQAIAAEKFGIENPFFRCHDGVANDTTSIEGESYVNFSSYNYLGLNGHPRVSQAAKNAIDIYGTSASASRPVSGERPIHRELEKSLAAFHNTEECVVFVSGHAANVTTIGCLFGNKDLIIHDSLSHNSVIQGAILSGAKRLSYSHNDYDALDKILEENRNRYERVIIISEGLYSMDGDTPDMNRIIEIKQRHKVFLMIDEAHSLGVIGENGRGIQEYYDLEKGSIDIIMGTLSKSLAACGGYIAGKQTLIENLKYTAPGFVYSVGMSPPVAAAALAALEIMKVEPERTRRLQQISNIFFQKATDAKLNTGYCQGHAIIPVILGSSILSAKLSNRLFARGINVQPIIYPAVEERAARLRFFLSATHTEPQIQSTIDILVEELAKLRKNPVYNLA